LQLLERLQTTPAPRRYERYQDDPAGFAREQLGSILTAGQVQILESVRDHKVTVVQSANGVGKTFSAADVALWFCRVFEGAQVYTAAAPPVGNLERLLWGEIGDKLANRPDLFPVTPGYLRLELSPKRFLVGVAIPTSGTPAQREAKFAGKHSPHLLFVIDEGDAVPDEVYRGIESCMSGGHVRLLVLFNPREQSGPVYRMIQAGAHVIVLDAFSHPNVTTGWNVVPGAVSREITVERICKWSRPVVEGDEVNPDGPDWFQVPPFLHGATATLENGTRTAPLIGGQWRKVTNPALSYMTLARFPGQAENQLISRAWVEAAQQRWLLWQATQGDRPPEGVRPIHGQDVAEFGGDRNASCFRYGGWVAPFETWEGVDVLVTGDRAAELAQERDARGSFVDATGVGSWTPPGMRRWWTAHRDAEAPYQGKATPVKVAEAPTARAEEGEFGILRDQLWWACREWLRTDMGAMLPPDEGFADELCAAKYRIVRGKIKVDDKDKLRQRLGRSPDLADALCLTFAPGEDSGIHL
jgi:hypothetical protein